MTACPFKFSARFPLLVLALVVVLGLGSWIWRGVNANWAARSVPDVLGVWEKQGWVTGDWELHRAFNDMFTAIAIEPDKADFHFSLARLHYWKARGLRLWPQQGRAERIRMMHRLKATLAKRPTWATAWVFLAMVKMEAGEADAEMEYALNKAIKLGFYETAVQHGVTIVGMRTWAGLAADTQILVKGAIMSSLENWLVNRFVIEQALATGWVGHITEEIEANRDFQRWVSEFNQQRGRSS